MGHASRLGANAGCGTNHPVDRGPGKAGQVGVVAQCAGAPAGTFADRPDGSRRTNKTFAKLGIDANKVGRWRTRYAKEGVSAMQAALRTRVMHWSCRSMARHLGTQVHRVWRSHGLKPHLIRTFKLSRDPRRGEAAGRGLYLDPPENAAVFSFDEKSQIQALAQPGLPAGTMAITSATARPRCSPRWRKPARHRHQEVDDGDQESGRTRRCWLDRPRFHAGVGEVERFFAADRQEPRCIAVPSQRESAAAGVANGEIMP